MILGKMIVFLVSVCILGKCFEKYSTLCVWSNVKQNNNKKTTPKTTGIHQKWEPPLPATQTYPATTTSHPATHREPNPHRNQPKTHPATHQDPLHTTKNQTPNQPNPINLDPPATIKPITGKTITQN
jgi:hypothetical protein